MIFRWTSAIRCLQCSCSWQTRPVTEANLDRSPSCERRSHALVALLSSTCIQFRRTHYYSKIDSEEQLSSHRPSLSRESTFSVKTRVLFIPDSHEPLVAGRGWSYEAQNWEKQARNMNSVWQAKVFSLLASSADSLMIWAYLPKEHFNVRRTTWNARSLWLTGAI